MAAQKYKQNCWPKFSTFLNVYKPKTQLIKALNILNSSRPYGTTGTSTELFLAKNDFKTSSTVNFPKKCLLSGDLEINQRHEPQVT